MPRIEPSSVPVRTGTISPPPYDALVAGRSSLRLGDAGGMTQFGVSLVTLPPGAASSMRHCHEAEDEFVMITEGTCIMVTGAAKPKWPPATAPRFRPAMATRIISRTEALRWCGSWSSARAPRARWCITPIRG